jgi:hypothetical protein
MPNPTRPQYKQIIESTWGLAVADTVTRRYASNAERDTDLAGFTAAQLAGQLIAIVPGPPNYPTLQFHNGTGWRAIALSPATGPMFQAGHYAGTVTGWSARVNYPVPMGIAGAALNVLPSVLVELTNWGGYADCSNVKHFLSNEDQNGFAVGFRRQDGSPPPDGTTVAFRWLAVARTDHFVPGLLLDRLDDLPRVDDLPSDAIGAEPKGDMP